MVGAYLNLLSVGAIAFLTAATLAATICYESNKQGNLQQSKDADSPKTVFPKHGLRDLGLG
ncbi:MAG: hypothetical protein RMX96_21375 [Nostoc sp. ChiSLP02]|nr:hypothetical protein [Nostoc sp. DedSLP05]MDZ8100383.1 hypothetical protein [Nostoc sp. DedSLP01]MDZ8187386.1 hypothetical protein [Nostoc sp. ChiSLP02]